jgi:Ca2+:H+ antiporter
MTAVKAAKKDQMQTVINIAFWASTATVLLTVPSMIILAYIFWLEIDLWLTQIQGFMLWFLAIASILKFWDWKVTKLEWVLFLVIFAIYIFMMLNWLME